MAIEVGTQARVLLVGTDRRLFTLARQALPPERYALTPAGTVAQALDALFTHRPDVVVVTSRPDGEDGTAACRELQAVEDVPVVVLVPSGETAGTIRSLTCADDYIALPVAPEEVEARVQAVLRRAGDRRRADGAVVDDGQLRVDLRGHTVSLGGGPLSLTPTEYRLLAILASNPGRVLLHDDLLRRVWGAAYLGDSHLLRLHVANLRRKIEPPGGHRYIRTHRGLGYSFQPAANPARTERR